jgi:hypothetical protein
MPQLVELAETAIVNKATLQNVGTGRLKDLLRYLFEPPTKGISSMKKPDLIAAVQAHLVTYKQNREEV